MSVIITIEENGRVEARHNSGVKEWTVYVDADQFHPLGTVGPDRQIAERVRDFLRELDRGDSPVEVDE